MTVSVSKPQLNLREELSALKKKTGVKGEELLRANNTDEAYALLNPVMFRNRVINGGLTVSQRFGDASVPLAGNVYNNPWTNYSTTVANYAAAIADRFMIGDNTGIASTGTGQRVAVTDNSVPCQYAIRFTRTSSSAARTTYDSRVQYNFEGVSVADYKIGQNGTPITISFYARASKNARALYQIWTDGAQARYCAYPIQLTTGWKRYVINVPANTDTTTTFMRNHTRGFGTGLYWSTSVWNNTPLIWSAPGTGAAIDDLSTSGDWLEFTGYQLEFSSTATPFEQKPYDLELKMCERYLEFYRYDSSFMNHDRISISGGFNEALIKPMRTKKRAVPTVTYNNVELRTGANAAVTINFVNAAVDDCIIYGVSTVGGTGSLRYSVSSTDSFLAFSSEV